MPKKQNRLTLQEWIEQEGGRLAVASRLGVSPHAVSYWQSRRGWPKVEVILSIIELSKGKLTFEAIVESTRPRPRRPSICNPVV